MTSTTPRDSLGRIVYEGDALACGATVERILPSGGIGVVFPNGGVSGFSSCYETVDLAASPPRTNHERYFADLGTREEVVDAADSCLGDDSSTCDRCPLEGWGKEFGFHPAGCAYFNRWLDERAVI